MCVAWIDGTTGAIRTLDERNLGWPTLSIPATRPAGRGRDRALLPHRRCLRHPQLAPQTLRVYKAPLGFGGHHARALPAASGRRVGAFFPARLHPFFLSAVPRRGRSAPLLVSPEGTQAQAVRRTLETRHRGRTGGRARNHDRGLDILGSLASTPGLSIGGV